MIDNSIQDCLIEVTLQSEKIITDEMVDSIGKAVEDNMAMGDSIFDVSLMEPNGNVIFSTSYYSNNKDNIDFLQTIGNYKPYKSWIYYNKDKYNRNVITFLRQVRGFISGTPANHSYLFKRIGYLSMTYYENILEDFYRDINIPNNNTYIINDSGNIISSKRKSFIGKNSGYDITNNINPVINEKIIDGKKSIVIYQQCTRLPWTIVCEIPYDHITQEINRLPNTSYLLIFSTLFLMIVISYLLSGYFAMNFKLLNNRLIRFANGEAGIDFMENLNTNEILQLGETFNNMAQKIEDLINDIYMIKLHNKELEDDKRIAELVALQAQINPHFLYNTLDSINWIIKNDQKENAIEMISSLGQLFRLGANRAENLITLKDEINYAGIYLNIQKIRLGEKLSARWNIDQSLLVYLIPKLILQPLIENAIHHGIQSRQDGGFISISCYEQNKNIVLKIMDDGTGIKPEQLIEIQNILEDDIPSNSIGIYNVQKRLELYFGKDYGLTISSQYGIGTVVEVNIPKTTAFD